MKDNIHDIRFHGRGGGGVVTGARLVAEAALLEEKFVHSFPAFGPERAGAPIAAFTRLSDKKFTIKTEIYEPKIVVVQDNTLLKQINVLSGIINQGIAIINHSDEKILIEDLKPPKNITIAMIDATTIAQKYLGRPVANTAMVGAVVKLTKLVDIENVLKAVKKLFPGALGEKNGQAILDAYMNVKIIQKATEELPPKVEEKVDQEIDLVSATNGDSIAIINQWTKEKWGYEKLPIGTVVPYPGSSKAFKTGDWAAVQPTLVKEKCLSCLSCFFLCPDTAIKMDYSENPKGYPIILTDYCKGCGICVFECEEKALKMPGISEEPIVSTDIEECDDDENQEES